MRRESESGNRADRQPARRAADRFARVCDRKRPSPGVTCGPDRVYNPAMLCSDRAWNNFVNSQPADHEWGSPRRAATVALWFCSDAMSGGLNRFLTYSHDLHSDEVLAALGALEAPKAQQALQFVLDRMGCVLPVMSEQERWDIMLARWPELDGPDEADCLTDDAADELMAALERHVVGDEDYYAGLGDGSPWPPDHRAG